VRSVTHLGVAVFAALTASAQTPPRLTETYCVGCHNQKLHTAGVSLQGLDPAHASENAAIWERVAHVLRSGQMPPPGLPRPEAAVAARFLADLEESLDRAAAAHPNPGRPPVHRLNRAEYSNAVRDLLAVDIQAGSLLPADDSGYGFDNIADVLSMSPALLERYLSAARLVSKLAVGDLGMKPIEERFVPAKDPPSQYRRVNRIERVSSDLPFDSRGGLSFSYYFPLDAEYVIRITLPTGAASFGETIHGDVARYEMRLPIKAGLHTVGATFLREDAKPEVEAPGVRRNTTAGRPEQLETDRLAALMDLRFDGALLKRFEVARRPGQNPDVTAVLITGPYNATGRGQTPSRERIFVCRPSTTKDEEPCARQILQTLSRRAFRRPVTDADLNPLLRFYRKGREGGDFDSGIQTALEVMLVSPDFLFRSESDPRDGAPGKAYRVDDYALASRLSFFLWSSIPDDELLTLAGEGKLRDPEVRLQQVRRMLRDRKSQALVTNFAGQWLQTRNLATLKPDPQLFPEFDESLRRSFQQQTELFFETVLREDRSVLDLLNADYTFLNQRLAEHYKVPNIYGSQLRRMPVTDPNRTGLLGQGSILAVTSYPNRTSPVQRGKWILENLLGSPPPPPPAAVPELKEHGSDGKLLTMRKQMEQHRDNPACSGCHSRMDPIGFALENYDAIGRWREKEAGSRIDATGVLPDGSRFEGPAGLSRLLATTYRDDFVRTVTEKLMTYALGRGLEPFDKPAVRSVMKRAAADNYRMSALIAAIEESVPFQMRRTPEP
jgi:Protein of unknown function (DUF1592)/Protein of unknown function (DUF1588)/Protein of unknown function (DUF1587)/Protein of unknown function (DUF1585)/Protein of unknown function (DUF1595)/Planctomycete cytochrome C